ncbi:DUF5994 family protein [Streptomyces sp. NPDC059999]|uniref:DUF5994 family protein n=1 Tax=Streptomyces sp. NPDC059999 TaxID=3347030 RepID=UPI00368F69C5
MPGRRTEADPGTGLHHDRRLGTHHTCHVTRTSPCRDSPLASCSRRRPPSRGQLDGAWWPRSRDLDAELPALVAALVEPWGRITRVTVNPARWPVVPHRVPAAGHTLHVGWFTEQDPDTLILFS